jgi:hypothetical protein
MNEKNKQRQKRTIEERLALIEREAARICVELATTTTVPGIRAHALHQAAGSAQQLLEATKAQIAAKAVREEHPLVSLLKGSQIIGPGGGRGDDGVCPIHGVNHEEEERKKMS